MQLIDFAMPCASSTSARCPSHSSHARLRGWDTGRLAKDSQLEDRRGIRRPDWLFLPVPPGVTIERNYHLAEIRLISDYPRLEHIIDTQYKYVVTIDGIDVYKRK